MDRSVHAASSRSRASRAGVVVCAGRGSHAVLVVPEGRTEVVNIVRSLGGVNLSISRYFRRILHRGQWEGVPEWQWKALNVENAVTWR